MKWRPGPWAPRSVASLCSPPGFGRDRSGSADSRWTVAWHVVFLVMLLGFTAAMLASRPAAAVSAVTVVLAALLAGWYTCWMVLRPDLVVVALGQLFAYLRTRWALAGAMVVLLLWLAGFGLDGSLASAGTLRWRGVGWPVVGGTTLGVALLALCLYSFAELSSTRSELAAAERQAGILGERQRIAGDIHDTLTQGLASVVMLLEAAQAAYQAGQPEAGRRIEEAARTAREALQDVRRLVWDLRPEVLERGTLEVALARLTAQLEEQTGMAAQMVVTGESGALAPQVEVTLLRVAQEALANVKRHARAQEVTVTLSYIGDEVALDVQDDGRGFAPVMRVGASPGGGLGLTTMRERVEALGGTLTVESAPGDGATVVAQLPSQTPTQPSIPALSGAGGARR